MGIASIAILIRTNLLIFLASRPISAGGLRLLRRELTAKACIKRCLEVPYLGEHNLADSSIPNESIIPILESIESMAVPTPSACCTARLPPSHRIQFNDSGLRLRLFPRLERLPILTNAFQQMTKRPREITVAAVVVFIGSSLFLFAGLLIAASVEVMLLAIRQKYPGVNFHNPNPDLPLLKQMIGLAVAIPIALGVTGILSGRGLLRMRSWARNSTIFWSVGSSLLCLAGLVYPGSRSGIQFSATPILALMLVLFPVDAWFLLLFFRPATKSLFTPLYRSSSGVKRPVWLKERFVPKLLVAVAGILLCVVGVVTVVRRNSPMREIERSRDALVAVRSWHYHVSRYFAGQPPMTVDKDTFCPSFQHLIASSEDANGVTQVRESLRYFSDNYNRVGDQWLAARQSSEEIFDCRTGPIGQDNDSLPLSAVIDHATVARRDLRNVDGDSCRDYEIAVPTPHDPQEEDFRFSICINERDHLPRETRRTPPNAGHEWVATYRQWNATSEPQFPSDFSK